MLCVPEGDLTYHTPVLLAEVVAGLEPRRGRVYVDATLGGGGHAEAVLRASAPDGRLIGLDWDDEALEQARERLREWGERAQLVRANFADVEVVLMSLGIETVDGVLLDLGVSSRQVDEPSRGFSFQREGPLDMRMDRRQPRSARELVRSAPLEELARIFRDYGEERRARAVAREIGRERERGAELATTTELAALVERVVGPQWGRTHPATRVFQALRIAVNHELENLERGLEAAVNRLKSGGRVAVISFHSLEDRLVKQRLVDWSTSCVCPPDFPVCRCHRVQRVRLVTRKPVTASEAELEANPRSRSAKLRVAEKI